MTAAELVALWVASSLGGGFVLILCNAAADAVRALRRGRWLHG